MKSAPSRRTTAATVIQPAAARRPAPPATIPPGMPRTAAVDPEVRQARAEQLGHHLDSLPIQRTRTATPARDENERTPLRRGAVVDPRPDIEAQHHQAIATSGPEDTRTAISIASGAGTLGSMGSRVADLVDTSYNQPNVVPGLGVTTGALSAVGSTVDAATRFHRMATDTQQTGDKAITGLEGVSSSGNATVSAASAGTHASTLFGTSATVASHVAAPAAMVMGGADLIGGGVSAYRARGRQAQLEGVHQDTEGFERGVASFAAESQRTRKKRGLMNMLKGGLAIGGGIGLLLGAGPVGWGLLGGAALVGGAQYLYKQYRKHKEGKRLLTDPDYRQEIEGQHNVRIPTAEDLAGQGRLKRWNPFNTKESRTHDLVRGQIATRLAEHVADNQHPGGHRADGQEDDAHNNPLSAIVGMLGLRNKGDRHKRANAKDIARALEG
jgi:hypothetical protein